MISTTLDAAAQPFDPGGSRSGGNHFNGSGSAGNGSDAVRSDDDKSGIDRSAAPAAVPDVSVVSDVAESLGRVMRAMQRAKAQFLQLERQHGGDWGAHVLLANLVIAGPQRVTALADLTYSDASTVSRQVSSLVKDGLVERQPDPDDGRASLLVATPLGLQAHELFLRHRNESIAQVLVGWTPADLYTFSGLLGRFADSLQASVPTILNYPPQANASAPGREEN